MKHLSLENIILYIENNLNTQEKENFKEHINKCDKCFAEYMIYANSFENINNLPEPDKQILNQLENKLFSKKKDELFFDKIYTKLNEFIFNPITGPAFAIGTIIFFIYLGRSYSPNSVASLNQGLDKTTQKNKKYIMPEQNNLLDLAEYKNPEESSKSKIVKEKNNILYNVKNMVEDIPIVDKPLFAEKDSTDNNIDNNDEFAPKNDLDSKKENISMEEKYQSMAIMDYGAEQYSVRGKTIKDRAKKNRSRNKLNSSARSSPMPAMSEPIPNWYLNAPKNSNLIYAVAMAESPDEKNAVQQAEFDAVDKIADRIKSKMNSFSKRVRQDVGINNNPQIIHRFEEVEKRVLKNILNSYQIAEKKIIRENNRYRAYVSCSYDLRTISDILLKEISLPQEVMMMREMSIEGGVSSDTKDMELIRNIIREEFAK